MMNEQNLALRRDVMHIIREMPLKESYRSEEREFQPDVIRQLHHGLAEHGYSDVRITGSVGGSARPYIGALGTDFWPDIEVACEGLMPLAIELKLGRGGLASAISQTLGQMLIYGLKWEFVVGFVAHDSNDSPKRHEFDEPLYRMCEQFGLNLIIRHLKLDAEPIYIASI